MMNNLVSVDEMECLMNWVVGVRNLIQQDIRTVHRSFPFCFNIRVLSYTYLNALSLA